MQGWVKLRTVAAGLVLGGLAAAQDAGRPLTFAEDVAPIVHARCTGCHAPGQAGPFVLASHADVARRAGVIADVVARGLMPPWLPVPGAGGPFVGDRSLPEAERATLLAWIAQGCAPGDLARAPAPPAPAPEWQLGPPDLLLVLEPAVRVPAEGRDVYRNFVLPVALAEPRWVRALEFDPGDRTLVHHAAIGLDSSGGARARDARDAEPGFPGMNMGGARLPDGHFLGWAPGKRVDPGRADMAWRLAPGDDLVLQLHLRPSGKPETIRPRVALHFAAQAPTARPTAIVLSALDLDIPAGAAEYVVEREYRLPVAASVLAIAPHAHYVGHDLRAWAALPDGREVPLIRLRPWDFDWQDSYRYVEPVALPPGTRLGMRYQYDNSATNPLNPFSPPRRIVYGEAATDEMGELLVQLLPADPDERETLERDFALYMERQTLAHLVALLAGAPDDARLAYSVALSHERLGEWEPALVHLRAVVRARPKDAMARTALGRVLARAGDLATSATELARAQAELGSDARTRQALAGAWAVLGDAQRARGDEPGARRSFEASLALVPAPAVRARLER
ncbi:MAG TPA: hypothetical protein VF530_08360 [Planctomycetota bacterium]